MCVDIKNMYLATPMERFEYMKMPMNIIPQAFKQQYALDDIAKNGFVYMQIEKGMY